MKKILIFGCSFSRGSYKVSNNNAYIKKYNTKDEKIKGSKGWYNFVDYFKDKDVTVIATSSQGYWSWYQVLLMMGETNKLNFNEIWIQETNEPRVSLIDLKSIELNWNCIDIIDGIKRHYQPFSEKHKHLTRLELTYLGYGFFENVTSFIVKSFQNFCTKKNINGYVWSMHKPIMNCTKFTRLPLVNVWKELMTKELMATDHQTEEGNKYIGKLINKACIDMKM